MKKDVIFSIGVLLAISLLVAVVAVQVTAAIEKVDLCHITNTPSEGDGHVISVADQAWPAHMEHGDKQIGEAGVIIDADGETCHIISLDAVDDEVTIQVKGWIYVLENDAYDEIGSVSVIEKSWPGTPYPIQEDVGVFYYQPYHWLMRYDYFIYQLCNTDGLCDTATVNINLLPYP